MADQDWNVQVLNKTYTTQQSNKYKKCVLSETHSKMKKIVDNTGEEGFHHEVVSYSFKMELQKARLANKMSQKDLALKIGEKPVVINEYESGKAIPNQQIIRKLSKALGVQLKK